MSDTEKRVASGGYDTTSPVAEFPSDANVGQRKDNADGLHRRLNNRQIQLIAIGGSIGTALFVSIGSGLAKGGPGSLFIAFTLYSCILALVNNSIAEMTTLMPVSGGFIRLAGEWVDDALGFWAGWNFFFYEALLIPFEITALTLVISFWNENITNPGPTAGVCAACIIAYGLLNVIAVRGYGEAEFWLSGGKAILIFMLFFFTFVTMCGGNPQGDAYGFRYWSDPGSFAEYHTTGSLGRFEGFLAALFGTAAFTVVGPEYISMVAAEAKRPRVYIKAAFKTVYFRFGLFFILGALCVGIVVPYNDETLKAILAGDQSSDTAAASPYVIAMKNMGIKVLPHLVNALMCTSIFSAGNTYTYCATRTLYGLALEGRAPRFLTKCNRHGVPIFAFAVVMLFPLLSFLQVGNGSSTVLDWLINIITAGGLIDYIIMLITYVAFYKALKAQGIDRNTLPYKGWFQPYGTYIALAFEIMMVFCYGYTSFLPWNIGTFFSFYTLVLLAPILYFGWKIVHKTTIKRPHEVDLIWERPVIDAYENSITTPPVGFWTEMLRLVGIRRRKRPTGEKA